MPKRSNPTDAELVRLAQKGDQGAFNLLYEKYYGRVLDLVRYRVSTPQDAEDVAQETFVKAWASLPRFRGEAKFYTWLYRIAANTAINMNTSEGRKATGNTIDVEDGDVFDTMPDKEYLEPGMQLEHEELVRRSQAAIENLPSTLKETFIMAVVKGLSYEEISVITKTPDGTVRSRIHRAREAIAKELNRVTESQ